MKKQDKGCGKLIKHIGNIDVKCGKNSCNGRTIKKDMRIHYCNKCTKELKKQEEINVAPTKKEAGQLIRNEMALRSLQTARGFLVFALERFEEPKNPDKPSETIIKAIKQLDEVVYVYLAEDCGREIAKEIDKKILDKIAKDLDWENNDKKNKKYKKVTLEDVEQTNKMIRDNFRDKDGNLYCLNMKTGKITRVKK